MAALGASAGWSTAGAVGAADRNPLP